MNRLSLTILLLAASIALPAAPPKTQELPPGALYRYRAPSGNLVITNTLPTEAIYTGYEVVDANGRVISTVEPALPEEERQKRRQELLEEQERKRLDEEIRRLYATPDDAVRARDRQITTLNLSIEYARNTLNQLEDKLNSALEQAASYEQQGKEVPPAVSGQIDSYTRQIQDQEREISGYQRDINEIKREFAPIIDRLEASVRR